MIRLAAILLLSVSGGAHGAVVGLRNEHLIVGLDGDRDYAIVELTNRDRGVNFVALPPRTTEADPSPWQLVLRNAFGQETRLTAAAAKSVAVRVRGDHLTVTWTHVTAPALQADLTVVVAVSLPAGSRKSFWDIDVHGRAAAALWQVEFPRVFDVQAPGTEELAVPHYWGRLFHEPTRHPVRFSLNYPQPASMQFLALWGTGNEREPSPPTETAGGGENGWSPDNSRAVGLYWAAEDEKGFVKRFAIDTKSSPGHLDWTIEHAPPLAVWPLSSSSSSTPQPVSYSPPYHTVIATFTGDYHEAAALYRDWARRQVWCQRGPADMWPDAPPSEAAALARWTPPWFRNIGFWAKFYHEPAKVLPEWAAYRQWLRVPMASHYYRYSISRFDDNYPEMLPPDPYFLAGIHAARTMGVRPLPYINGVIWDTDTPSWVDESGLRAAVKNEAGSFYPWRIGNRIFACMCPATKQWQVKVRRTAEKLIWEHGVNGVYLDCLAATRALPCYDPRHGHTLRGGDYNAQGNRRLLFAMRQEVRRRDREACFFTEEVGEQYLDVMDGFLTLDLLRTHCQPGEQVFPLFSVVYHPYTINFGSDARLDMDEDAFAWQLGQTLVWGEQPLLSAGVAAPPRPGAANSEFLREVVHAYYQVGQRFLQGGSWRRLVVAPEGTPPGAAGLELVVRGHRVSYSKFGQGKVVRTGPAVLGSAWERQGDLGIVLVNITSTQQSATLVVRDPPLNLPGNAKLVRVWPRPAKVLGAAVGSHKFLLPARKVQIYALTTKPQRAFPARPLDADLPWKLLAPGNGEFPALRASAGSLWACADSMVENVVHAETTVARPVEVTPSGKVHVRRAKQAQVHGPAAEGRGLPRAVADQPFLLLRKLPHSVTGGQEPIYVAAGGDSFLSCQAGRDVTITFAHRGRVVVADGMTGRLVTPAPGKPVRSVTTPAESTYIVGYAQLDVSAWKQHLADSPDLAARCKRLCSAARVLGRADSQQFPAALAKAMTVLFELERSLGDLPGALAPTSPLMGPHHELQSLAAAQACAAIELRTEDDWLAPGVTKTLQLSVTGPAGIARRVSDIIVTPLGDWPSGAARVIVEPNPSRTNPGCVARTVHLSVNDPNYVQRMVPVAASARITSKGETFILTDIVRLEANRPLELHTPSSPATVVAGRRGHVRLGVRNWSPLNILAIPSAHAPAGWRVHTKPGQLELPGLAETGFDVEVEPPSDAARGLYEVRCQVDHAPGLPAGTPGAFGVSLLESLVPLVAQPTSWKKPAPGNRACFRQRGKVVLFAHAGDPLHLTIHNRRVTHYTDALSVRLLDPELAVVWKVSLPVDARRDLRVVAKNTGVYFLELIPGAGSALVDTDTQWVAEVATKEDPLSLYCSPVSRFFFVPAGATAFRFGAQDGGPDETARFILTSPTGRVAFDFNGNYNGAERRIEVRPDEAGKVWRLVCEPRQDVTFWLAGEVCPYLSTARERLLVSRRALNR